MKPTTREELARLREQNPHHAWLIDHVYALGREDGE